MATSPTAAALELLYTAFLVHDDVEDDGELRRGEPKLHRRNGPRGPINAGDALAVFALGALRDNDALLGRRLAGRIWAEFEVTARPCRVPTGRYRWTAGHGCAGMGA